MHSSNQKQSAAASEARSILDELNQHIRKDLSRADEKLHALYQLASEHSSDEDVVFWYSVAAGNIAGWIIDNYRDGFEHYIALQEAAASEFLQSHRLIERIAASYRYCAWRLARTDREAAMGYLGKLDILLNHNPSNAAVLLWLAEALADVIDALAASERSLCLTFYNRLTELANMHPDIRQIHWCRIRAVFALIENEPDFAQARRFYEDAVTLSDDRPNDAELKCAVTELGWKIVTNQMRPAKFDYGLQIVDRQEIAARSAGAFPDTSLHFAGTLAFLITRHSATHTQPCLGLRSRLREFASLHTDDALIQDIFQHVESWA